MKRFTPLGKLVIGFIFLILIVVALLASVFIYKMRSPKEKTLNTYQTPKTSNVETKEKSSIELIDLPDFDSTKEVETAITNLETIKDKNEDAKYILDNVNEIPDSLIKLASNRVDALDFVADYPNKKDTYNESYESSYPIENSNFPLYILFDKNWGYSIYDDGPLAVIGCGPASAAMILTGFGEKQNPRTMMDEVIKKNYYINGTGTSWEGLTKILEDHKLKVEEIPLIESKYKEALNDGKVILLNVRPGLFTTIGHFLFIRGYDENGFYLNDSNSIRNSLIPWKFADLAKEIRASWTVEK